MSASTAKVGVVVIGRNEGDRLKRCLYSLVDRSESIVYVDSGSTDDSVHFARSLGVEVVELDLSLPFSMARGRNAGFRHLVDHVPGLDYVQFVDGDCEVVSGWIEKARETLVAQPEVVAVTGRRRERHPEVSIYNKLCDMEWNGPIGEIRSTGGDVMIRAEAFNTVGGFREDLIAGEEPELCVRLRKQGGIILRLAEEMTLHDAAMTRFGQWWRRSVRAGYAYAKGALLHGRPPERHNVRDVISILLWALFMPVLLLVCVVRAILVSPWIWIGVATILLLYVRLGIGIYRHRRRDRADAAGDSWQYAFFCVLGKFPQLVGIATCIAHHLSGRSSRLIEYKESAPATSTNHL